ncbi:PAS domain-containing sensor histidine kinase [Nautilia sp.]
MSEEIEKLKQENEKIKKENEALKKELNYLKQIKEALDKTMIISKTDEKGIITDVNEMFEKISGFEKEELIGRPHSIVRHPQMPRLIFKKLWNTIKKGKIFKAVIKNRKKDGGEYYVLANIIPIKDEKGNIKEYIAIRQDITKRMQLQEEKELFVYSLIDYFLKKLKNPTFVITKNAKLIEEELSKKEINVKKIKQYNKSVLKEGYILQRSYNVLKTILAFKNKKIKPKIESVNIAGVIRHLFRKYYKLYDKNVKLKILNKNIMIETDRGLFLMMLEILYMNALLYSENNVTLSLYKENGEPVITIENDGETIKDKLKVFDFFHQLKNNSQTGMGLFLVKKIANLFEYDLSIKTDGKNIITLRLKTAPPKKLLNQ